MESKQKDVKTKPLTPDFINQPVDFRKHIPWLKTFKIFQPPRNHTIEVRKGVKEQ